MVAPGLEDVLLCVPHAVCRVDGRGQVQWVEPEFNAKTGLWLAVGDRLFSILERNDARDRLERDLETGVLFAGVLITSALQQVRVQTRSAAAHWPGEAWVVLEQSGLEDEIALARAIQEIARTVGEILEVDAVCAAAVMSMVRCAPVARAEVYLVEGRSGLKRVAVSDVAGSASSRERATGMVATLKQALASNQPQIGIVRSGAAPSLFAAIPLATQRCAHGLLVLYKAQGTGFSAREMDLWSAAGAQLAVTVENARLLRESQAALRSRDEFMSIASHELKTPLTPLKMSLYTMERKIAAGEPVALSTVLKSKRQVERLTMLVSDLLDASRVELGKLSVHRLPLDLSQLVVEVVEQFRGALDRELRVTIPSDRLWVMADRDRLEQVLVNLLENAQKYSPGREPVSVMAEREDGTVVVRVEDHGIGIPTEDQDKIFQRFHRAQNVSHRNFGGLGLGLFISESVMRFHGGALTVKSQEGQGSTFVARLSALSPAEVTALPRRVLLLEERAEDQAEAARILSEAGYEVHGRDSLEPLRNLATAPLDLVVISTTLEPHLRDHFLQTLTALPLARPVPLVFAGPQLPAWASSEDAVLCSKPYTVQGLGAALSQAQPVREGTVHQLFAPPAPAEEHAVPAPWDPILQP